MSSIMRSRSALTGECEGWDAIGQILSSRRLQDLRCSGADAPIVTPERSSLHRGHRETDDLQAHAPPAKRVRSLCRKRTFRDLRAPEPCYEPPVAPTHPAASIISAHFSPIIMQAALVLPETT